jgi:F-type H+-transporting ATPase subunit delta
VTGADVVRGYARALFDVAEAEGVLGKVEDELFRFARALEANPKLREALTDASLPVENRTALIRDLLEDRAHPVTLSMLGFVVESGRARDLAKIIDELARIAAEQRQQALAEVRSAVPLTKEQTDRLAAALGSVTGREVDVKVVVDPSVVGGFVARVGDEVFDGSLASRLEDVKGRLS